MKRILLLITVLLAIFVITGCGDNKAAQASQTPQQTDQQINPNSKTLVVYFSMPETTTPDNMTQEEDNSTVVKNNKVLGNTQFMAETIANTIGADTFRIVPINPYPTDHKVLIAQAKEEQNQNARPKYEGTVPNLADYDTIFIGYPNWWGDMPMILYTFLENNKIDGKTIIPFGTHGGSGFSNTVNTIQQLQPNAKVSRNGLMISRNDIQNGESTITSWLRGLGYAK